MKIKKLFTQEIIDKYELTYSHGNNTLYIGRPAHVNFKVDESTNVAENEHNYKLMNSRCCITLWKIGDLLSVTIY